MGSRSVDRQNASFDGLRGVAAIAVVWFHLTLWQGQTRIFPYHGYLAVDFFFILSGFVVARAYEHRLAANLSFGDFMQRRLIRLYPLILLGLAAGFIHDLFWSHEYLNLAQWKWEIKCFVFEMFLVPARHGGMFPLNYPLWSLLFELGANIVYAAVAKIPALCKIVVPAVALAGAAAILWRTLHGNEMDAGYQVLSAGVGVTRVGFGFFMGAWLSRLLPEERIAAIPAVPFPVLASLLIIAFLPGRCPLYDMAACLLVFPILVTLGARDVTTARVRKLALHAGALSYPLYMMHAALARLSEALPAGRRAILPMAALFLAAVVIAEAALHFYDMPVRNLLTRLARSRSPLSRARGAIAVRG